MQKIALTEKRILVTGGSGFIGANLIMELLRTVSPVYIRAIDNHNAYYDIALKEYRYHEIEKEAKKHSRSKLS